MKKVFSSILFACIAMVGLLTSCVEEQIETTFEVDSAKAYVTVQVFNIATDENVTSQSTITTTAGSVSGNVVTLVGNNSISETVITVAADYKSPNGNTYHNGEMVTVNSLRAGGVAYYTVTINVGEVTPIDGYTFRYEEKNNKVVSPEIHYFDKATIKEANKMWAHNESEWLLRGTVNYDIQLGCEVYAVNADAKGVWDEKMDKFADSFEKANPLTKTTETKDIVVSAWSYYTCFVSLTIEDITRTYYAIDLMGNEQEIGEFSYWKYPKCEWGQDEMASPSHKDHYVAGHGHDDAHGHSSGHGGDNAGGGIVLGD